jgi:ADP-heptose:LPS heptosyltransferase
LGDTIQFCRFAKMVSNLGARVILEVQEPLVGLLATLEGASQIVSRGNSLPTFDYHCPLLSLPLAFNTNLSSIPCSGSYLSRDASKVEQWQAKLGYKAQPRIGLAWSGNAKFTNDRNRSLSIAELIEHLPSGFQYVSLQKEVREADRQILLTCSQILSLTDDLIDFTDTAALCDCLDLVISVDTSVAHLSAALGKTTWLLLPFNSDWRWLMHRDDSPWYPAMKLYRQDRAAGWGGVLAHVARDLAQFVRLS